MLAFIMVSQSKIWNYGAAYKKMKFETETWSWWSEFYKIVANPTFSPLSLCLRLGNFAIFPFSIKRQQTIHQMITIKYLVIEIMCDIFLVSQYWTVKSLIMLVLSGVMNYNLVNRLQIMLVIMLKGSCWTK